MSNKSLNLEDVIKRFEMIGLTPAKAKETAENKKLSPILLRAIEEAKEVDTKQGALLYMLSSTIKNSINHLPLIAKKIAVKEINSQDQVTGTFY